MAITKDWFDVVSLAEAKTRLKIEHDFENDDIESLIKVAVDMCMRRVSLTFEDLETDIPLPLVEASKHLVCTWYTNRTAESERKKYKSHYSIDFILQPLETFKIY